MRLVVLDGHTLSPDGDLSWESIAAFGELEVYDSTAPEQVVERAKDADVVILNKVCMTAELLCRLPKLRLICVIATGYDVVDIRAAGERGVYVCNTPAYGVDAVAQHVFALLLELCRRTALHDASIREGAWQRAPDFCYWLTPQQDLAGKTLGVVGFGNIGRRVAELGHAFGMNVLACSRSAKEVPAYTPFSFVPDIDGLFSRSDVVSLHCALTPETRGLANRERLKLLPRGAMLINTARGPLVDETAVAEALTEGRLGGFASDVLCMEPPSSDNPLLLAPRTLFTPHLAWATFGARRNILRITGENIRAFLDNRPIHVVNAQWMRETGK